MKYAIAFWSVAIAIAIFLFPVSAIAGSSSLIRAYDDEVISSKDFAGQNLQEAEFASADLKSADFSDADLRGAVFNGCSLVDANFHGANFGNGIAYLSNFKNADLTDAIFTEALMLRSVFDNAKIEGADFSFAILDRLQQKQLCQRASGVNSSTGIATKDSLGC
ncbi:pentapeptide repeat-containing protein [Spirulina sp. 06S082]|uniref:pentapeptide repeat-containing protein n=1 Tax=Spirulina sp. 06S082 TaxID=3110248 RepID=UPI002B1F4A4B|nr:pentapeptide repeat-containing protein [Spirulina sp. 06S082]MEA5469507.1 pentapeptide repeat-containing protein [Spirulina sp. 06S082]